MLACLVRLPSGVRYWTVLDEALAVIGEADAFLRHVRFGRDCSELTTKSYAGGIALFLRWCDRTGRHWHTGAEHLGLFITWLLHADARTSGVDVAAGGEGLHGLNLVSDPVLRGSGDQSVGECAKPWHRPLACGGQDLDGDVVGAGREVCVYSGRDCVGVAV